MFIVLYEYFFECDVRLKLNFSRQFCEEEYFYIVYQFCYIDILPFFSGIFFCNIINSLSQSRFLCIKLDHFNL